MNLAKLIKSAKIDGLSIEGNIAGVEVADLILDSRQTKSGGLFAALPGTRVNGSQFASDAISAGAVGILAGCDVALNIPENTVVLRHEKPAYALSQFCRTFFGNLPNTLVAVTGTNGKTSVVNFLRQIWQSSGKNAASLGTLGVLPKGIVSIPELTSPDAITLHRALSGLKNAGIDSVALEASSHGLDQFRLHGLRFAAGGFTNFTQDHLDYHGDMDRYLSAKSILFHELCDGPAVINATRTPQALIDQLPQKSIIRVGQLGTASNLDIAFDAQPTLSGLSLTLDLPAGGYMGTLKMVGLYQTENVAMAAGLALASGLHSDAVVEAMADLTPAPGRMHWAASHPGGGPILVDYAHTADALAAAIAATRAHVQGRLIVVFGAGGDRDPTKRAPMGRIVSQDADIGIVTDDNPRSEAPGQIREAILQGCPQGIEIGDRREAIRHALSIMQPGDGVLVAGKGHELGQKIANDILPFDDVAVVQELAISTFSARQ